MVVDLHPHLPAAEAFRFDQLESNYNFGPQFTYLEPFLGALNHQIASADHPLTILDIGCGQGIGRKREPQAAIAAMADQFWGIEPDDSADIQRDIFDRLEFATIEDCQLPANSVDLAYSFMVMEHVREPRRFLEKLHAILKPGGSYLFATPNAQHLFGFVSLWAHRLKVDELLLKLVRGQQNLDYHYPVQYRINSIRQIQAEAQHVGLNARVAYWESPNTMGPYFPGPLRLVRETIRWRRRTFHQPKRLLNLLAMLTKPAAH